MERLCHYQGRTKGGDTIGVFKYSVGVALATIAVFILIALFNPWGLYSVIVGNLDYASFAVVSSLYVSSMYAIAAHNRGGK